MNSKFNITKLSRTIALNYYWFMIMGYIIALLFGSFSIVIFSSVLLFFGYLKDFKTKFSLSIYHIYFFYCIFSVVIGLFTAKNITLSMQAIAYSIMPMLMLFVSKDESKDFYKRTFDAIFFSLLLAIVLYLFPTQHYANYLYNRSLIGRNDIRWVRASLLQGLYGITTLSSLATFSSIYFLLQFFRDTKKINILKFVACVVVVLFSGRRSAVAALIISLVIIAFALWLNKMISTKVLITITILFILSLFSLWIFYDFLIGLLGRVVNISGALNERNSSWGSTISSMGLNILLGKGLGTSGHLASAVGRVGSIHDGQYILLIVETGLVGFLFFLFIILNAIKLKNLNIDRLFPFLVVIVVILQCIGSNVLEMPMISCLFWYCISDLRNSKDYFYH